MKKMIGRVGRDLCTQLRGLLVSQRKKLEEMESKIPKNDEEIQKIKDALQATLKKLEENGCI